MRMSATTTAQNLIEPVLATRQELAEYVSGTMTGLWSMLLPLGVLSAQPDDDGYEIGAFDQEFVDAFFEALPPRIGQEQDPWLRVADVERVAAELAAAGITMKGKNTGS